MNTSSQFYYPEFGIPNYLIVWLSALPFSIFLISFAINQSDIISFYLYVCTACIIVGLPFIATLNREYAALLSARQSIQKSSIATPRHDGNYKDWQWRGWKIRYTFLSHPQSQLSVILLHGFGASVEHWRHNIPELGKYYNVYALDLLGFGASAKPDTCYGVGLWVEQVYDFWQTFIKRPAVLVGNSIGCATSLAIAATYLQMVRGIATISLPNVSSIEELIPKVMGLLLDGLKKICSSRWLLKMLFYFLRYPCVIKHWPKMAYARQEAITEELIEIFTAPVSDRYCIKVFFTMSEAILSLEFYPCIRSCLSKLQIPSLLFWGQRDRMIPHGVSKRFLNYNLRLQLIEIENAGHYAHDEYPEQVNQQLLLWIQTQVLNSYVHL